MEALLRRPEVGAADKLARWSGSFIPFVRTETERRATGILGASDSELLFGLVLASMMLPGAVTMIPNFLIWNALGQVNSPTFAPLWAGNLFGNLVKYVVDSGDSLYRRSMYTFWKRAAPPAQMDILNAPNRELCTVRRDRT